MRMDLGGRRSRILFFALVVSLAALPGFLAARAWLAEHWNGSAEPALWRKAAELEPDDASYWAHIGVYDQRELRSGGARRAAGDLERATAIDSRSDEFWLELASAYEAAGDQRGALRAYRRAQADAPISSDVAWRYGSFLLRRGDRAAGFAEIRRALAAKPSLAAAAVSECWQADPEIGAILDEALPARPRFYFVAIDFFLVQRRWGAALAVWNRLLTLGAPIRMAQALPLVDALIEQDQIAAAEGAWRKALGATGELVGEKRSLSLVYDGGFERQPVGGGFGWREGKVAGVAYALDGDVFRSGSRSMRVTFDGTENLDFANLVEYVPVQPGRRYRFSAYLRTKDITTDSGLRFWIHAPRHPGGAQVLTPSLVGTNEWTRASAEITAGKDTDVLAIALRRIPSEKFDNKLAGTAWIDDVSLVPAGQVGKGGGK